MDIGTERFLGKIAIRKGIDRFVGCLWNLGKLTCCVDIAIEGYWWLDFIANAIEAGCQ